MLECLFVCSKNVYEILVPLDSYEISTTMRGALGQPQQKNCRTEDPRRFEYQMQLRKNFASKVNRIPSVVQNL